MSNTTVITDHKYRNTIDWIELTAKEKREFDWIADSDTLTPEEAEFIRYKGQAYCMEDFMRLDHYAGEPAEFASWQGYSSDTFFSGILVKYNDDGQVMIGRYYS